MARNELVELLDLFSQSQSLKDREVLEVRVVRKRGVGRALVKLPGCDQEVLAQEPTPIACGAAAQAVINRATGATTILPGPRSEAGQTVRILKQLPSFEPPAPTFDTVQFLILKRDGGGLMSYDAYRADGTLIEGVGDKIDVEGVGTAFFPEVSDGLGPGSRIIRDENTEDLVVVDFLGPDPPESSSSIASYTPPSPWIVTNGQKVGTDIYWWEWQASQNVLTTPVRLMKSTTADLSAPSAVFTGTAASTVFVGSPDWDEARGPDFTDDEAGLWLTLKQTGSFFTERIRVGLDGTGFDQLDTAIETSLVESVLRAGHAATSTRSITQKSTEVAPTEADAFPSVTWDGDPENNYVDWASVGDVIDIAPDPTPGFWWVLKGSQIERYDDAGVLQQTIPHETFEAIGLSFLDDTFDIPIPPPEE